MQKIWDAGYSMMVAIDGLLEVRLKLKLAVPEMKKQIKKSCFSDTGAVKTSGYTFCEQMKEARVRYLTFSRWIW